MQILKNEDPELAEALLNQQNSDGWTPLHVASNEGHVDLIELFVEFGGCVDARSRNFRTPLHIASIRGNLSVIQAVLMAGADINAKDIDGNTPCHFSSEYGHKDCLRYLLLKHPSLISKNKENQSPLDVAVNTEILQVSYEFPDTILDFPRIHYFCEEHSQHSAAREEKIISRWPKRDHSERQ
jgi:ankyrin repeat protein